MWVLDKYAGMEAYCQRGDIQQITAGKRRRELFPPAFAYSLFLVVQDNLPSDRIDLDDGVLVDGTGQNRLRKLVDRHQSLDRTGTIGWIVAGRDHVILGCLELDRYTLVGEPVLELPHLDVEDHGCRSGSADQT